MLLSNLFMILKAEPAAQAFSAPAKAAVASMDVALKDAMSTQCNSHANFMLACRDRYLAALPTELFTGRPGLSLDIRTAPFEGPLLSSHFSSELGNIRRELDTSASRRPYRAHKKSYAAPRGRGQSSSSRGQHSSSSRGGSSKPFRGGRGRKRRSYAAKPEQPSKGSQQ